MTDLLSVDISGAAEVQVGLNNLYPYLVKEAVQRADDYIINALQTYDTPYTYVAWASIGGFRTERQRRFVMMMLASGEMSSGVDARTFLFAQSWVKEGSGENEHVVNTAEYAPYLMGVGTQFQMHVMQGWLDVVEWLGKHEDEITQTFRDTIDAAVQRFNEDMSSVAP